MGLVRCQTCRLTWFPQGGAAAACPACAGQDVRGALELFHIGVALIVLGLMGYAWPLVARSSLIEIPKPAAPVADKVSVARQEERRVAVKDRHVAPVHVNSRKTKKRQKAKTRSKYVQR